LLDGFFIDLSNQRRIILWCLSNISAGAYRHALYLLTAPIFNHVMASLIDPDYRIVREALYVINNTVCNSIYDLSLNLYTKGLFEVLMSILNTYAKDVNLINLVFNIITSILESGQCVIGVELSENEKITRNPFSEIFISLGLAQVVEQFQLHQEEKIYEAANQILKKYFVTEDIING
jgi:hypothetical protein